MNKEQVKQKIGEILRKEERRIAREVKKSMEAVKKGAREVKPTTGVDVYNEIYFLKRSISRVENLAEVRRKVRDEIEGYTKNLRINEILDLKYLPRVNAFTKSGLRIEFTEDGGVKATVGGWTMTAKLPDGRILFNINKDSSVNCVGWGDTRRVRNFLEEFGFEFVTADAPISLERGTEKFFEAARKKLIEGYATEQVRANNAKKEEDKKFCSYIMKEFKTEAAKLKKFGFPIMKGDLELAVIDKEKERVKRLADQAKQRKARKFRKFCHNLVHGNAEPVSSSEPPKVQTNNPFAVSMKGGTK